MQRIKGQRGPRAPRLRADVVAAIVAERAGVLALARRTCGQIDASIARGRMGADEASLLKERLRAFADAVAQGLHVTSEDDAAVRAGMRAALAEAGEG